MISPPSANQSWHAYYSYTWYSNHHIFLSLLSKRNIQVASKLADSLTQDERDAIIPQDATSPAALRNALAQAEREYGDILAKLD